MLVVKWGDVTPAEARLCRYCVAEANTHWRELWLTDSLEEANTQYVRIAVSGLPAVLFERTCTAGWRVLASTSKDYKVETEV